MPWRSAFSPWASPAPARPCPAPRPSTGRPRGPSPARAPSYSAPGRSCRRFTSSGSGVGPAGRWPRVRDSASFSTKNSRSTSSPVQVPAAPVAAGRLLRVVPRRSTLMGGSGPGARRLLLDEIWRRGWRAGPPAPPATYRQDYIPAAGFLSCRPPRLPAWEPAVARLSSGSPRFGGRRQRLGPQVGREHTGGTWKPETLPPGGHTPCLER